MNNFQKYIDYALEHRIRNAKLLSINEICFDTRAILKCRYGCNSDREKTLRCSDYNLSTDEKISMLRNYSSVLLLHCNNAALISKVTLDIERLAFLDGCYFALAVRCCNLCKECLNDKCKTPELIRPCEQNFGIDVYKTARNQGLECNVLQDTDDMPNRFGFVFLD